MFSLTAEIGAAPGSELSGPPAGELPVAEVGLFPPARESGNLQSTVLCEVELGWCTHDFLGLDDEGEGAESPPFDGDGDGDEAPVAPSMDELA